MVATCECCFGDREVKKIVGVKSKVCLKCQRINQCKMIAKINRFGRKHSEETKAKIGAAQLGRTGELSPSFGKKRTDEHKAKIAEAE